MLNYIRFIIDCQRELDDRLDEEKQQEESIFEQEYSMQQEPTLGGEEGES